MVPGLPTRRAVMLATAAALVSRRAWGAEPISLAALVPLTGAGGPYGPVMAKAAQSVVAQVNAAGGVLGRQVELTVADDQTNPDAAVRAARQLIAVNKVCAIMGTWASSVTTAVAPLCWENQVFLTTVSGAESITQLPTQGYLIRTQPTTRLQGTKFGQFAIQTGAKKVFFLSPQTPFFQSMVEAMTAVVTPAGGTVGSLVYEDQKPSYRGEVDAALRAAPDTIILGGYTPDTTVVLKDLFRAGYTGGKIAFGYAVNQKLVDSLPADVVEGCYTLSPAPAEGSHAYDALAKLIGVAHPDTYTAQIYDQTNLVLLAIAAAGDATGTAIRDTLRKVSQAPGGEIVESVADGLAALGKGQPIAYQGASGPCKFTERGDIQDASFRYEQVKSGKIVLLKIA